MAKRRKKKLKIKWKNFIIFLIIVFLLSYGLIKGTTAIYKYITTPKPIEEKKDNQKKEEKKKEEPKKENENDLDYKKLDYINKEIDYFNDEYLDRYLKYKEKNPKLSNKQIVIDVNIGLDYPYYENSTKSKHLHKDYILVNKYNYLDNNYVPKDLEKISTQYALSGMKLVGKAKDAFEDMASDAKKDGYNIIAMSSYRSYDYQINLYNKYVKSDGKKAADTYSGRPGYSEHQTGLAVDVYNGKYNYTNFGKTKEYLWMQKNAHKYGFILRFPENKEKETGYKYESWHYRYVGKSLAKEIYTNDITLEEYHATHNIK